MNFFKGILKKLYKNSAVYLTYAGWLDLPLIGTGARKGLSVSINNFS